jgi:predicted dehydrogenase
MGRAVRWGVLSTAHINDKVLAGASASPDVDVVAVASRDGRRAEEYAARKGIPTAHDSYEALLADDTVDAVYVPLPNGLHHEWTMQALRAGKHVLCEKPYSRRPREVTEAFDEAEQRGLVLSEAFMYRYSPQIRELARQVLEVGVIGDIKMIVSSFSWPTPPTGDVRLDPALDGGSLMDVGVYCVSAARLLAGEPTIVAARQVVGPTGVDTTFAGTLEFAGGVLAHFDSGFHLPNRSHLEIVGAAGSIRVADPWHGRSPDLTLTLQGESPRRIDVDVEDPYRLELEEFGRAVRREDNVLLGRADATGQVTAVDALYRAADSGQAQLLD